ncbi:MAG: homocysteine S-methyltransferase family protein, partial [Lentisphaeria bacterium]|nr:homocysteine S-methyltransferase family protein [Lentisphaeria bacterium]
MTYSEIKQRFEKNVLVFDGAFGTELYRRNFFVNTSYDNLNLAASDVVASIHQAYVDAGADVLTTNTYSANSLHLGRFGLAENMEKINSAAVALARKAAAGKPDILVAGSVGPAPADADMDNAVSALQLQCNILCSSGADFIIFESVSNLKDLDIIMQISIPESHAWMPSFVLDS